MNIKDYLHFYLGCEVAGYKDQVTRSKIVGFYSDTIILSPHEYATPAGTFTRPEMRVNINAVKPILRPLSDMTEEEAIKVGEIVIGRYDSVKFKVIKNQSPSGVFRYWKVHKEHRGYGKSLTIDENGEVDVYDQHDDGSHTIYAHQHEVTRYLLSCGFDLFGLIYEGLAIDKTKV